MLKRKEILFDTFLAGLIFLMVLLMLILNSCKHEMEILPAKKQTSIVTGGMLSTCDPDSVYFENQILPLLISNCAQSIGNKLPQCKIYAISILIQAGTPN